jgi:hypothetical protein
VCTDLFAVLPNAFLNLLKYFLYIADVAEKLKYNSVFILLVTMQ